MKRWSGILLAAGLALLPCGCGKKTFDGGPTVDAFTGRVTHDGQPVAFPPEEKPVIQLFHEKGHSFGIPIQPDGTFKIGWMPIGKYAAILKRENTASTTGPGRPNPMGGAYNIPGGLTIEAGKTEYTIELGNEWKP